MEGARPCYYQECQDGTCTSGVTDMFPLLHPRGVVGCSWGGGFSHMWLFLPLIHLMLTQLRQSSGKLGCFHGKRCSTSLCCMVVTGTKLVS